MEEVKKSKEMDMLNGGLAGTLIRDFLEGMEQLGFSRSEAIALLEKQK